MLNNCLLLVSCCNENWLRLKARLVRGIGPWNEMAIPLFCSDLFLGIAILM
jgi:hypothetical protein